MYKLIIYQDVNIYKYISIVYHPLYSVDVISTHVYCVFVYVSIYVPILYVYMY